MWKVSRRGTAMLAVLMTSLVFATTALAQSQHHASSRSGGSQR
jgi:hypothetical protein